MNYYNHPGSSAADITRMVNKNGVSIVAKNIGCTPDRVREWASGKAKPSDKYKNPIALMYIRYFPLDTQAIVEALTRDVETSEQHAIDYCMDHGQYDKECVRLRKHHNLVKLYLKMVERQIRLGPDKS